jgi:hypothetical protein
MDRATSPVSNSSAAAAQSGGAERRVFTRVRVDRPGELLLGPLRYACSVLDLSIGGAQLALVDTVPPLSPATLRIGDLATLHCRVVWRRDGRTGVRFMHDPNWVRTKLAALFTPT